MLILIVLVSLGTINTILAQPLPENIDTFLQEVMRNERMLARDATEYTGDFEKRVRWYKRDGSLDKEDVSSGETYQTRTRNEDVTLVANGITLDERQVAKIRARVTERMIMDQQSRLQQPPHGEGPEYGTTIDDVRMSIFDIARGCGRHDPRWESVDGRVALAIDLYPCVRATKEDNLKHFPVIRATFWIDQEDRIVSLWRVWKVSGDHAGELVYENRRDRLSPGDWRGGRWYLNLYVLGQGPRRSWEYEVTNMRRFGVTTEETIGVPPSQ